MEDQEVTTATTHIVKGKRTKRQRVQSPIPFGLTTNSSSSGDGVADDYANIRNNNTNWSPTTSNNNDEFQDSTEEEEDMANCLILLARGRSIRDNYSGKQELDHHRHRENYTGVVYTANKFNSRKFLETASTGAGKVGYYVYECKTCNRTFPSFQALGGHRASHKKLKSIHNDEKKQHFKLSSDEEDGNYYRNVSSLSLQLSDSNYNTTNNRGANTNHHPSNNKAKIHECSICGAEFTSGQALGGHMRRHRGLVMPSNTTALSLTPTAAALESEEAKEARNLLSLDLDLNLPAPDDDDNKLPFASKQPQKLPQPQQQQQQQTPIVFSSPALVGCHY